jgi:hypothetical protein
MRALLALALTAFASPALAQDGYEALEGLFGSANDPAASCAANPHELDIIDNRPHLARTWKQPVTGTAGSPRLREVYDVEAFDGSSMILMEEGLYHADLEGTGGPWVLQLTQTPPGYCWRRPNWPLVRCEDQQLRCEDATS